MSAKSESAFEGVSSSTPSKPLPKGGLPAYPNVHIFIGNIGNNPRTPTECFLM